MKHIYYKNDFAVEITLLNASGEPTAPPVWEWSVEFSDGRRSYVCALKKGNAKVVDKKIICYLDRHMLGCGVITYKFVQDGWLTSGAVQEGGSNTTVPLGRSRISLEKECVKDETTGMMRTKWRRVRLLYGIAFIKKKYVDKVTRLDLSRLATNIATFHLCWDGTQYVPEGEPEKWSDNFHWIFNK